LKECKCKNEVSVEDILLYLKPIIEKMTADAPEWGSIELTLFFNQGIIKRIETSLNNSIQYAAK
jgi:hypothetical protein